MDFSKLTSSFNQNPILYSSIALGTVALALGKSYFSGGKCTIRRNLKGQVVVITGANTGIGRETARVLAEQNATVILACRDLKRTEPLLNEIQSKYGKDSCQFIPLDLADLESVKKFSQEFNQKYQRLDILLNNAGIMSLPQRQETKQGFEMQFGTNHLGHFLLTGLLLDTIKKTPQSRIINVSSLAHKGIGRRPQPKINFDDIMYKENYHPNIVYGQSKLANVMFTRELQRRLKKANCDTKVVSLHPGVVRTELGRHMLKGKELYMTLIYPIFWYFSKNPYQGAQTNIQLCMEEHDKLVDGEYYADCVLAPTSENSKKAEVGEKLFNVSEQLVGFKYNL